MRAKLTLDEENKIIAMFVQALLGAISPNFRRVAICFEGPAWLLSFVLEHEDATDTEEIEDVADEFDVLLVSLDPQMRPAQLSTNVTITDGPLEPLDLSRWSVVFRRRED
jgi:hypothetical protein